MLFASTIGLGPYRPTIKLNDSLYILNEEYDSEDDAVAVSIGLASAIDEKAFEMITAAKFTRDK